MADLKEKKTNSEKLDGFLEKNKKWLFAVLAVAVIGVIAFAVVVSVSAKSAEKTIAAVDEITYTLTKNSADLEDAELSARRAAAVEAVAPYLGKSGVGGVRANMLAAELAYSDKDFAGALEYWTAAASKGKKSYTAPLCYYNMGACSEELGKLSDAAEYYKKAADDKEFVLKSHAMFSLGRVYEALNDKDKALETYNALVNESPDDTWAKLAKTRVLALGL